MPNYNNPKDMEPSKLDSLIYTKECMYLTSLDYVNEFSKETIKYHIFRDDDKVVITWFENNKPNFLSYTESAILFKLNIHSLHGQSSPITSFWQNVLQAFKGSEQFLVCECGCKKEFPNSNIGHFRYCNYMKSNPK